MKVKNLISIGSSLSLTLALCGCVAPAVDAGSGPAPEGPKEVVEDRAADAAPDAGDNQAQADDVSGAADDPADATPAPASSADDLRASLHISERCYEDLDHGPKPADCQKYIVLHDTEGDSSPADTIDWWELNGNLVAAHFVVGKDGSIAQCVPLDRIAHHAGFGDAGKNALYGVEDESRDDKLGTQPIGPAHPDYGMNSWSVGIEIVHVGGSGDYPKAQLEALDGLVAYIDAYYGFESTIIDHKAWRDGNSDTSPEFAAYLANYQETRTHDGQSR